MKKIKKIFLLLGKLLVLFLVGYLAYLQLPELLYDLSEKTPTAITSKEELTKYDLKQSTFVAVQGRANFANAFSYQRYGLTFTYFTIKPYGLSIVARTHEKVTDEWTKLDRFLGKMRPFAMQPFSYRIEEIFQSKMGISIPQDAYFLALDDVPEVNGWQVGAILFSIILWGVLVYLFFFYRGTLFTLPAQRSANP